MYALFLYIHSYWRWVVLLSGLLAVAHSWLGLIRGWPWLPRGRRFSIAFVASTDLQLILGLTLFAVFSPFARIAFSNFGAAMRDPMLRFFTVEHTITQLVAIALLHVGNARAKRADSDKLRYRRFAVYATIALILMLIAIPWPMLDIGRPLFRS